MNLTPKAYKRMVRIAQCVEDFGKWTANPKCKGWFINKWEKVYTVCRKDGTRYEFIFYHAMAEVAKGELDGHYAKAFA